MEQYHQLLKEVLGKGEVQFEPRTAEYILGISSYVNHFDLREGFPLSTTKKIPPRLPFEELFWKLRGERNVLSLIKKNIDIWTPNAFDWYLKSIKLEKSFPKHSAAWNDRFKWYKQRLENLPETAGGGDLGRVYGYQWRHAEDSKGNEVDQLKNLLKNIKEKPGSRYNILCAWNSGEIGEMAIGPCPFWHQFTVYGKNLDLTMVQRSCDIFLGVPFNDAQDSLLTHMVAQEAGLQARTFNHHYVNTHAYLGVPPRSDFWIDEENVQRFQKQFNGIGDKSGYMSLRDWYLHNAPEESPGNERKDHIPFILEQLSQEFGTLPTLEIKNVPFLEAIQGNAMDFATIKGYLPAKWDSKAVMAA